MGELAKMEWSTMTTTRTARSAAPGVLSRRISAQAAGLTIALFITAGTIKSSQLFQQLPIDLTLTLGVMLVLATCFHLVTRGGLRFAGLAWATTLTASGLLAPTVASSYTDAKVDSLILLTMAVGFFSALTLVSSREMLWGLLVGIAIAGTFVGALLLISPSTDALGGRIALSGAATIGPARATGAALAVLVPLTLARRVSLRVSLPLILLLAVLMLSTGSRGPVGALGASVAVSAVFLKSGRLRSAVFLLVGGIASWRFVQNSGGELQARFVRLFSDDQGASITTREDSWAIALHAFEANPLGLGWGGLEPILPSGLRYPHNIILEIAAEAGVVGLAIVLGGIALVATRLLKVSRSSDPLALAMLSFSTFCLLNAMVSGDINDNREMFVALGVMMGSTPWTAELTTVAQPRTPTTRGGPVVT